MIVYKCDRCGQFFDLQPPAKDERKHALSIKRAGIIDVHLCDDCKASLATWMEGGQHGND